MKMVKKLSVFCLVIVLLLSLSSTALAAEIETNGTSDGYSQPTLYPGEVFVNGKIFGVPIISEPNMPSNLLRAAAGCPNYAESHEYVEFVYKGYIQFRANYLTQEGDGSGLIANRHVMQGWIDYRRNDKSVIQGTKYTAAASGISDPQTYSQSATCNDSIIDWGESGTTKFYRGWIYFG